MKLCSRPEVDSSITIDMIADAITRNVLMVSSSDWELAINATLQTLQTVDIIHNFSTSQMYAPHGTKFRVTVQLTRDGEFHDMIVGR